MKALLSLTILLAVSNQALAKNKHEGARSNIQGHCGNIAMNAAINKWANVPNPSPVLEYYPFSSLPSKKVEKAYDVVLALFDGNQGAYAGYLVTFKNLSTCEVKSVQAVN